MRNKGFLILALLCWLIAAAVLYVGVAIAQEEHESVTVQCGDKCKMVDYWNDVVKLEQEHYDTLARLRDSLIHEPPGLVRSLDRELVIKELQGQNDHLAQVYKRILELERK
jgi:hypothetical protein